MLRIQSDFPHNKFNRKKKKKKKVQQDLYEPPPIMFIEEPLIGVFWAKLGFCSSAKLT